MLVPGAVTGQIFEDTWHWGALPAGYPIQLCRSHDSIILVEGPGHAVSISQHKHAG